MTAPTVFPFPENYKIRTFAGSSVKNILAMSILWTPGISLAMPLGFRLASADFTELHTYPLSLNICMSELRECASRRYSIISHFG